MYNVRLADENDVAWICGEAAKRMLCEELSKPQYFNPYKITTLIHEGISNKSMWIVLKNDVPIGALGALAVPNVFNPNITTLVEIFWWVDPEYRSTRAGYLLLKSYMDEASKYQESTMSLLSTSEVMNESLLKRGYELREYGFHKEK